MLHTQFKSYPFWIILLLNYSSLLLPPSYAEMTQPEMTQPKLTRFIDKSIFLLAGQSNMAGRGGVINNNWDQIIPPPSCANPTILRLDPKLHWHEAKEPLHRGIDINHTCGVGPGLAFANSITNRVPRVGVVGLVPCAEGGTNISQWAKGGRLYGQLVRRATASLRDGGSIQALVWYQGESDTLVKVDAERYQQRLEKLFLDIRTDLQSPMLPIIQVAIASGEGPYIEEVRQAQMAVNLLNLKTIDAKGLALEPDKLHLTTPAQVQLALKLADAFLEFLPTQVQTTNPNNMLLQTNTANLHNLHLLGSSYTSLILFLIIYLYIH
ncbi:putative carbohydrate esterase At4g34215 [Silene latifolia]|uniref:putative carbohydrate esterase At4g34215 n=1 Tax=Silene latifolia TaxID=37657 RepID=UPI003D7891C3